MRIKRQLVWRAMGVILLLTSASQLRAAIPAAAMSDPRYPLGYLVVTYYAGVDPTGVNDSTAGIQQAIEDAHDNHYTLFFPAGTYKISDTLRCYSYELWSTSSGGPKNPTTNSPRLAGSKLGAGRPIIKLAAGAAGFGDVNNVRPMIAYRLWRAVDAGGATEAIPSNAFLTEFGSFENFSPNFFDASLRNIDFDCNGNAGAVGVTFDGAQNCSLHNVRVVATGAYAGFFGLPAGVGSVANIEVEGGRYGVVMGKVPGASTPNDSGTTDLATIAGLRLLNQTVVSLVADNYSGPVQAVGFYIKPAAGGNVVQNILNSSGGVTSKGTFGLFDGTIDMSNNSGVVAITNTDAKTINVRNVYVTGTDNLIKSGSQATVTGTGTWKRIVEYTYTDQRIPSGDPPYELNDAQMRTFSIINGTSARTPIEPVKVIENGVPAPPPDLLSRHIWSDLPSFEDGPITDAAHGIGTFENPLSYGATPENFTGINTGANDSAAFQQAIAAASAAGHGRVVVPRGEFHLTNTLTLNANTKLIGAGSDVSVIKVHDSWKPTSGSPFMIQTVDDANATTFMGWVTLVARTVGGTQQPDGTFPYDRFSHVLWRAGRNSMSLAWTPQLQYLYPPSPANPRTFMTFRGGGGGRHYGFAGPGRGVDGLGIRCLVFDHTAEPTWMYLCNVEITKAGPGPNAEMNIGISNSANIRLIGLKREGHSPTVIIDNSTNVALFGHENRIGISAAGDIQILGASTNILIASSTARGVQEGPVGNNVLHEAITGQPVLNFAFPEAISIYKRGELDDAAVYISGDAAPPGPFAPSGLTASVLSSNEVDLAWVDNASDEEQFRIERKTNNGGYELLAVKGSNTLSHADLTVVSGNNYTYRVRAENTDGNSPWSNEAEASTMTTDATLAGDWPFEEGSGTTTADLSGNSNTGTLINGPVWTNSLYGSHALYFDGVDDRVDLGNPASLQLTGSVTWAARVNLSTLNGSMTIVSKQGANTGTRGFVLRANDTGTFSIGIAKPNPASDSTDTWTRLSTGGVTTNTWYHVAGVYDAAARTLDIYINGVLSNGTMANANPIPTSQNNPAGVPVSIGSRPPSNAAASNFFPGLIDDVRIYGRALTTPEIAALANGVSAPLQFQPPVVSGGQIHLSWTGTGQLEEAAVVTGPWTPILPAPSSPFATNVISGENRFFRLRTGP